MYAGASVSGESIFVADNQYASLSAVDLGDFGISSFEIELKVQARAGGGFPESYDYGALFIRSSQTNGVQTGPSSFIWSDGRVLFRMSGDTSCLTAAGAVSDWNQQNTLKFTRTMGSGPCSTLKIVVNGVEVISCLACDELTTSHITSSEMWIGCNHKPNNHAAQSLNMQITQLQLTT